MLRIATMGLFLSLSVFSNNSAEPFNAEFSDLVSFFANDSQQERVTLVGQGQYISEPYVGNFFGELDENIQDECKFSVSQNGLGNFEIEISVREKSISFSSTGAKIRNQKLIFEGYEAPSLIGGIGRGRSTINRKVFKYINIDKIDNDVISIHFLIEVPVMDTGFDKIEFECQFRMD